MSQRRHRYRTGPKAVVTPVKALTRAFLASQAALLTDELAEHAATPRPRTRGDCVDGPRPCPWICRHSLLVEITAAGSIKELHPAEPPAASCALDVADRGPATLDVVGQLLNVSRERARQEEQDALARMRKLASSR